MPTKIEWTDETWNPVTGCTPVSEGCAHCYAARMAKRLAGRCGYPESPHEFDVTLHPDRLGEPLRWRKPRRVFVCSMGDLFHPRVGGEFIAAVFAVMAHTPQHKYQVLTKRPAGMLWWMKQDGIRNAIVNYEVDMFGHQQHGYWPLPNVWLGVTAENQSRADERIPLLLQTPAAVRFVSVEPMLGPIDLRQWTWDGVNRDDDPKYGRYEYPTGAISWVICGGETGPGARPMHPAWARSLLDQCQEAGVPFFFKKWGGWMPSPYPILLDEDEDVPGIQIIDDEIMINIVNTNTKYNHQLDGREWNEYPEVK